MPTPDLLPRVCPLCRTVASLDAGTSAWRCATCHQSWDATRLATVAAYAAYCHEHAVVPRRTTA